MADEDYVTGYVFAPRLGWDNETDLLPVIKLTTTQTPVPTTTGACAGGCPTLKIDAYPLAGGRCEGDVIYRTVYMRGQGGSGLYTYFWDGRQVARLLQNKGYGFEVNNLGGGTVIGQAKVTSSDGQTAEKALFITEFDCD